MKVKKPKVIMTQADIDKAVARNACGRMSRADVAVFFDRSLPWVDRAAKNGIIPPPIKIGAPMWLKKDLEAWIERLSAEAIGQAQATTRVFGEFAQENPTTNIV